MTIWRALLLALFFLSGVSGLLYEVAWTRMLHLLFGDTVLAVSTVLASFMAGLALGSFWIGRSIDRRPRVLTLYAALEVGIALTAVLLPVALHALTPLYVWLHQHLHGAPWLFALVRFVLAFGLLCVPTSLMGATLPVLSRFMVRNQATLGFRVGTLYALNTGGAVIGCFAAGYVLLGQVGLARTIWIGAGLNLLIALAVWLGRHRMGEREAAVAGPMTGEPTRRTVLHDATTVRRVLWAFTLSGCAALSYEVVWTRALTFFIGNSTYAFTAMLTTFLCGLALGSVLLARASDRIRNPVGVLGALQVGIGVYGVLTIAILGRVFYGLDAWWEGFSNAYWGAPVWLTFLKTFVVILPPTLGMGAAFPLVARVVAQGPQVVGRGIGTAYACNTLGAIAGSWLSGFVAIPLFGIRGTLVLTSLLSVAVGGVLLAASSVPRRRQSMAYAAVLAVLLVVALDTPRLRFADIAGEPEKQILHYEEDVTGVVKVATDVYDRKLLSINGWSVAGTGTPNLDIALVNDYPEVQKMLAHLPVLLHPDPREALVIGFGAGGTVWSLSRHASLTRIDVVEFVPGVIRAAPYFPEVNHGVLADPRVRVTIDDGRNHLLVTPRTYDVVSVDTLDPKHAGNGNLYTREFYALSRRVLRPGGIFVQWLPYHQVDNESLKLIARTFQHVYPHATLWLNRFKGYALLVGTLEPLRIDVGRLEAQFRVPAVQRDLAEVHVATAWQLLEGLTMRPETLRRYTAGSDRLNTYDHPYVEFYGLAWHDPVDENLSELARFADDVSAAPRLPRELHAGGGAARPPAARRAAPDLPPHLPGLPRQLAAAPAGRHARVPQGPPPRPRGRGRQVRPRGVHGPQAARPRRAQGQPARREEPGQARLHRLERGRLRRGGAPRAAAPGHRPAARHLLRAPGRELRGPAEVRRLHRRLPRGRAPSARPRAPGRAEHRPRRATAPRPPASRRRRGAGAPGRAVRERRALRPGHRVVRARDRARPEAAGGLLHLGPAVRGGGPRGRRAVDLPRGPGSWTPTTRRRGTISRSSRSRPRWTRASR